MNCFDKILNVLSPDATGAVDALTVALMQVGSHFYSGEDVDSNPVDEALRRLAAAGVNDIALSVLRPRLHTLREAYACGTLR